MFGLKQIGMLEQILTTKRDIEQFLDALSQDRTRLINMPDGGTYFELSDANIPASLNIVFYKVLEDRNLDALVVKNTYVICHETIVDQVSAHFMEKNMYAPTRFVDMMKGAEAAAA